MDRKGAENAEDEGEALARHPDEPGAYPGNTLRHGAA